MKIQIKSLINPFSFKALRSNLKIDVLDSLFSRISFKVSCDDDIETLLQKITKEMSGGTENMIDGELRALILDAEFKMKAYSSKTG